MFKVSNNIMPDYINAMFSEWQQRFCDGNESQLLRSMSTDNFILPKPNKELFKNSFAYSGPVVWNCSMKEIKMATSSEAFKMDEKLILHLMYLYILHICFVLLYVYIIFVCGGVCLQTCYVYHCVYK